MCSVVYRHASVAVILRSIGAPHWLVWLEGVMFLTAALKYKRGRHYLHSSRGGCRANYQNRESSVLKAWIKFNLFVWRLQVKEINTIIVAHDYDDTLPDNSWPLCLFVLLVFCIIKMISIAFTFHRKAKVVVKSLIREFLIMSSTESFSLATRFDIGIGQVFMTH